MDAQSQETMSSTRASFKLIAPHSTRAQKNYIAQVRIDIDTDRMSLMDVPFFSKETKIKTGNVFLRMKTLKKGG